MTELPGQDSPVMQAGAEQAGSAEPESGNTFSDGVPRTTAQPISILLVDDDQPKRYTIAHVLRREGYHVVEGGTGSDALRLAAQRPDLIVLDVHLPDVDGFQVCRQLKADPATASIPVLHLSSVFVGSEFRTQGLDSGADGYLSQMIEPPELVATVRALLRTRRAEEAARRAARQWQATFDAIRDGIALLDRNGVLLRCNAALAGVLGRPGASLEGESLEQLLPLGDPDASPLSRLEWSCQRESIDLELPAANRRAEQTRWLQMTADPLCDEQGQREGHVCVISDITDRKRMEAELRLRAEELATAARRKDEFLAMLAHELRNPLAAISYAVRLMRPEAPEEPEGGPHDVAERQLAHLSRLVDDLLDVARITRGKIELHKRPVDAAAALARVAQSVKENVAAAGHTLQVSLSPEPLWVDADLTRLEQIFTNLLGNAIKYTPDGGEIELSATATQGRIVVRVRDNGIGISNELRPHVFDLFTQADHSLDRAKGGLGIGLALVQTLVTRHGGEIALAPAGDYSGSEFVVTLPALAADRIPNEAAAPAAADVSRPYRVLLVEDQVPLATMLTGLLVRRGHHVHTVHDGPAALAAATAFEPEVILLDIGLPGMSGYEVARRLRSGFGSDPPLLVALTGYGQEADRRRSHDAGFDQHLVKPVSMTALDTLFAQAARAVVH